MSDTEFKPGFPYYIYVDGFTRKLFEIKYADLVRRNLGLPETTKAYVDPSEQYKADGSCWEELGTRKSIPAHWVEGWREA